MLHSNSETIMTKSLIILNDSQSSSFFPTPGTTGSSSNSGSDGSNSKRNSSTKKKNNRKRGSKSTVTKTKPSVGVERSSVKIDISDDEQFVEHVASQYTTKVGPLGPLMDDMLLDNHHHHLSSSQMECEHSTYLKKLSNSPALVLNADYKV